MPHNLPPEQLRAEKLQTTFNNMSNRDQNIIYSLILSSKSVLEKASVGLTTGALLILFEDSGISTLTDKILLHDKILNIIQDFKNEEREEEVSKMYRTMRDYAPTRKRDKMWKQELFVMNDMGFLNLLMSITTKDGQSALTVLKNDIIKCIRFAERVVVSIEERHNPNFLEVFFKDFKGVKGLKGQSLMKINGLVTHVDRERIAKQKRIMNDTPCINCKSFDHDSIDCR